MIRNSGLSQCLAVSKVNNSYNYNAKNTDKAAFLHVKSGNPDNNASQFLEIANVNNSIYNNSKNTDKTTFLCV